ncbi:SNF2 family helicase [Aspergillus sp. HF37]|nr:SNF2 family helicase [Aspergillus sp. HF37]
MAPAPGKRKSDAVDLTGDDQPSKAGRVVSSNGHSDASNGQRFGQDVQFIPLSQIHQPIPSTGSQPTGGDEDDAQAADLVQGSQDIDDSSLNDVTLYDKVHTKIVGVRFYTGHATLGEHAIVNRQPDNPYDANAIQVRNVMGAQIGHLPRQVAAKLAKYMDAKSLVIEGVLTGVKGAYDCPIALKLFGTTDPAKKLQLRRQLEGDRLRLGDLRRQEREESKQQKQREKEQKAADKKAQSLAKAKAAQSQGDQNSPFANLATGESLGERENLEDIIGQSSTFNPREIGQVVEKFGMNESVLADMPMADAPAALSTELLPFQRQGLAWMIDKESPALPASDSENVVQLWKKKGTLFTNIATNFSTTNAPPLASGGILADDMGLGKTIQVISLILGNSQPKTPKSSRTTLIISPVGVMSNWKYQIQDHSRADNAPNVLIYHGTGKKEAANLGQYDVVVTSYGSLASEYQPNATRTPAKGIYSVHWRRVVLDEGHTIRNPRSNGSLAASRLQADSRWTLTGTPIINSLKDLYSQVRFLRLSGGLEDMAVFNSVLARPLMSEDPDARLLLQALMGTICLRRRKDMGFINLRLPPLNSRVLRVKFHPHEQEKYQMFESEAKGVLSDYKSKDNVTYSHLLEVLLRLRQVCNHWSLCKKRIDKLMGLLEEHKVVPLTPENVTALREMLQLRIESQEVCSICLDVLEEPIITPCAHAFDRSCIEQVIERQHKCPLCRADIENASTLVSPAVESGEDAESVTADPDSPSSKIEALIKILTAQGQAQGTKTVIFSQWTSFLDLVEPHLTRNGIGFARIDGRMTSDKRDNSTYAFTNDQDCKVLLASLNVCSVGLNLAAANQAILADSWWAPAIEDQAVDRVYRLGQKRDTTVWRLVMEDSIEDRVLAIQERKRNLMLQAFSETSTRKKREDRATRVADLEKLLT